MTRLRWYTWQEASERYWLQRAKRADRAAGRNDASYLMFERARSGWRLLAFTFLAWEILGRDPVVRAGNPFRRNGGYSERWDFAQDLITDADLTAILDGPPVLGSLVISPAGLTDAGLAQALAVTGRGPEIPELGEDASLSHVCATATHFYNRTGTFHALVLPDDGPPRPLDPQEVAPELCRELAEAYDALQKATSLNPLDWATLARLAATIQHLTGALRQAIWLASSVAGHAPETLAPGSDPGAPALLPAPSHEVILHLLQSLSPLTTWRADAHQAPVHASAESTLFVPVAGKVITPDRAWDLVGGLSDESLLVFLIAISRWSQQATGQPVLRPVPLSVQDILAVRGIAKHKHGGYKTVDRRRIVDQLDALNAIWVSVQPSWGTSGERGGSWRSRLLEVTPDAAGNPYEVLVAPGAWITASGDATRQLGYWFETLARLDRRHEGLAMRLGLFLCLQYRVRAGHRDVEKPWRVASLVSAAQPGTGDHPGDLDRRNPKRVRWQLEGALDRLQALGVLESWEYAGDEPIDEGKGWFDTWLAGNLVIRPPQVLIQRYQAVSVSPTSAALPLRTARSGKGASA